MERLDERQRVDSKGSRDDAAACADAAHVREGSIAMRVRSCLDQRADQMFWRNLRLQHLPGILVRHVGT
jgi:hypothetical protein